MIYSQRRGQVGCAVQIKLLYSIVQSFVKQVLMTAESSLRFKVHLEKFTDRNAEGCVEGDSAGLLLSVVQSAKPLTILKIAIVPLCRMALARSQSVSR